MNFVTCAPTSATTPENSLPSTWARGRFQPIITRAASHSIPIMLNRLGVTALKLRAIKSPKLTLVARTRTRISFSLTAGFSISAVCSTSGVPYSVYTTAFILAPSDPISVLFFAAYAAAAARFSHPAAFTPLISSHNVSATSAKKLTAKKP